MESCLIDTHTTSSYNNIEKMRWYDWQLSTKYPNYKNVNYYRFTQPANWNCLVSHGRPWITKYELIIKSYGLIKADTSYEKYLFQHACQHITLLNIAHQ